MRDWIKVRKGWYEGLGHRRLSGDALHLGPCLMFLADATWQPGEDEGALLDPGTRKPLTLADASIDAALAQSRAEGLAIPADPVAPTPWGRRRKQVGRGHFSIKGTTYQRLQGHCATTGRSVSGFIEDLLAEKLATEGDESP